MKTKLLPPDVAAYLVNAAKELMTKEGFIPSSEAHASEWLARNVTPVAELARTKMNALVTLLLSKPEAMQGVQDAMLPVVYARARANGVAKKWNPRYVAYASEHGCAPDEMLRRDGGQMTNFLCWTPQVAA